jgi:hypothetical protein
MGEVAKIYNCLQLSLRPALSSLFRYAGALIEKIDFMETLKKILLEIY